MTLTKKSLALAMALLMVLSLALVALPQEALATGTASNPVVYIETGDKAHVEFTMPSDGLSYKITSTGLADILGNAAVGTRVTVSVPIQNNAATTIAVTCYDQVGQAGNAGNPYTIITNAQGNTPNMTANVSANYSLNIASIKTTNQAGNLASIALANQFSIYYNSTIEITYTTAPGVFSGPLYVYASNGSVTTSGMTATISGITASTNISAGGGTYVPGTGSGPWNVYDDVYSSLGEREYYGRGDLTYNVNASKSKLEKVGVNRQMLTEGKHYTVASDGYYRTNITLKESFLNTLPLGYNRFAFSFTDGSSHVEIRVRETGNTGGGSVGAGNASALRSLTVYNRASSKGRKLGTYSKGADIRVTGYTSSGTYALVDFGGETGYVKADYINASLADAMTARTSSSSTALYTRKSTSSKYRYAKVNRNTVLTLLAREGSYWKVDFNDETLYVRAKDVKDLTVG